MALRLMLNIFPARRTALHVFVGQSVRDNKKGFDANGAVLELF